MFVDRLRNGRHYDNDGISIIGSIKIMFALRQDSSGTFWQKHQVFTNNLLKAGGMILALKVTKLVVDVLDL